METTQRDILNSDKQQVEEGYLLEAGLKAESMPKHIGVIPDRNRRWARQKGWPEKFGHMSLALLANDVSHLCCKCGIKVLTAFLFSSDNWKRSRVSTILFFGYTYFNASGHGKKSYHLELEINIYIALYMHLK